MSRKLLDIDCSFALKPNNPAGGMGTRVFKKWLKKVENANAFLLRDREEGKVGFFSLPYYEREAVKISRFAARLRKRFDRMVVLGIGGSALGTKALLSALPERKYVSRVDVADNIDPEYFLELLGGLDLEKTVFNVISKSGGTSETLAQFYLVKEALKKKIGDGWKEHMIFTTDPKRGLLRELAEREGIASFSVPENVGGRFSVFSPVGLLPLAFGGVNVSRLLEGARILDATYLSEEGENNPVLVLSAVYSHFLEEDSKNTFVLFVYSYFMRVFGEWFCQLWGESLGKRKSRGDVPVGQTPVVVTGVTDQHSQLQLYSDGPDDKIFTFLKFSERRKDLKMRGTEGDKRVEYLEGRRLGELFDSEYRATLYSLVNAGRPVVSVELSRRDELDLGAAIYLFECVTALVGVTVGVNPFDQPGVEYGKKLTKAMMGDGGHAVYLEDVAGMQKREGRKKVAVEIP